MKNAVFPLFAYPVAICGARYQFSESEQEYISNLAMAHNTGNSMSIDDAVLEADDLSGLKRFIEVQIQTYKKGLLRMKDDNEIYITQSWINVAQPGQFHPKHKHPNSVISGVLFLDDNEAGNLPPIRFHRTLEMFPLEFQFDELNEFNATCRTFDPEEGMLILFPSLLEHDVEVNKSGQPRASLSFNTYVRGDIGQKELLTAVSLP